MRSPPGGRARRRRPRRRRPTRSRGTRRPRASPCGRGSCGSSWRRRSPRRRGCRSSRRSRRRRSGSRRSRPPRRTGRAGPRPRACAPDRLRRRDDDRARPRMDAAAAEDRRGLPEVGHRPVRAVADVDLVDRRPAGLRHGLDVARQVRERHERLERREVDLEPLPERRVRVGALRRPGACGHGPRGTPRPSSSAGKMPVSEPASTAMFATARRSSTESASAPGPTNSSTAFVPPPTPISREHGEDHVLARDEAPGTAAELDLDRLGHRLPERAEREARGDVRRAEPRPERAERAVGAGVRVAARDHRPRARSSPPRRGACARCRRGPGRST